MLFSDKLLEIGRDANPRSNYSLMNHADEMRRHLTLKLESAKLLYDWVECKRLETTFDYVMKTLAKEGFNYAKFLVKTTQP